MGEDRELTSRRAPAARAEGERDAPPGSGRAAGEKMPLRFLFLGAAAFERDGSLVTPGRPKVNALAAYLVLGGEVHSRNALAALLWPDLDGARGLGAVRNALWRLAQLLGSRWLVADHSTMRVRRDGQIWVDVLRFRKLTASPRERGPEDLGSLRDAIDIYRGDFLEGLRLPECPAFEEWLALQREELRRLRSEALGRLATGLQASGRIQEAIVQARRWVAVDSFNEHAHRLLMRALAAAGRRADAQAQFDQCAELLQRELGVRPDSETVALLDATRTAGETAASAAPHVASPALAETTLPAAMSEIVGREAEISLLMQRLDDTGCRLLTITGLGGVGKTTLALEVARRAEGRFQDGARFVSMAKVASADRLEAEIAEALGIDAGAGDDLRTRLVARLRLTRLVLILDSFEHLLPELGVVAEIVEQAPSVKVLVTSRERLSLRGEWEFALGGLRIADGAELADARSEAMMLFAQAARRANASFVVTPENAPTVRRICRLLDGIPLAIELAAAWIRTFGVDEIAAQVERDLGAFSAPRDAPTRQRSMRASYAHSYGLLTAAEQTALRRLTVFQGGASLEGAVAVASASGPILESLIEKSLVRRDGQGRYDLHQIVRQFAGEELSASPGESAEVSALHATFTFDCLASLGLATEKPGSAVGAAGAEMENVRAAWAWCVAEERFTELSSAAASFCLVHEGYGRLREGAASVRGALERARGARSLPVSSRRLLLGRLLAWQGRLLLELGDVDAAAAAIEDALHVLRQSSDEVELARALLTAGRLALLQGNAAAVRWSLRGSLALARSRGLKRTQARVLREFMRLAVQEGDGDKAMRMLRRVLRLAKSLDDRSGIAACAGELGVIIVERAGDIEHAERAFREGLVAAERSHNPQQTAMLLERLGQMRLRRGDSAAASQDFARCLDICGSLGLIELEASAQRGLGLVALAVGDIVGAELHLGESLRRWAALGARQQAGETLEALGRAAVSSGHRSLARERLHAALATAVEIGATPLAVRVLREIVNLSDIAAGRRARSLLLALDSHLPRKSGTKRSGPGAKGPRDGAAPSDLSTLVADVLALPCSAHHPDVT